MTDLIILKGKTFTLPLRLAEKTLVYKAISAITLNGPPRITAAAHGVPPGWLVVCCGINGPDLNSKHWPPEIEDWRMATVIDPDTIEYNEQCSGSMRPYVSGGYVVYRKPMDLSGIVDARMDIKDQIGGSVLESLTLSNGKIVIDNSSKTVTLGLTATATAAYGWTTGVYDLEIEDSAGVVTLILQGGVTVEPEVTT